MTELFDIDSERSFFHHLVLGSSTADVEAVCSSENYDSSRMEVELKINGVLLRLEDFNSVMENWADRIEDQVKEKYNYLKEESSVNEQAKKLLKDKLSKAYDILMEIENSEWKLDE